MYLVQILVHWLGQGSLLKNRWSFFALLIFALWLGGGWTAKANTQVLPEPRFLEDTGRHFELPNPDYLDIVVDSSETIKLRLETGPEMISIYPESTSDTAATELTVSGLTPQTTYHKYEDDYHNHTPFTSDADGRYSYTQDLSAPHVVFIQPRTGTKFLSDAAGGGDCVEIGNWDATSKTCTLTRDVNETIQIDSNNLTLDGNGYTMSGSSTGSAIYLFDKTGVVVKSLTIQAFYYGVHLQRFSHYNIIEGITGSWNTVGIYSSYSSYNIFRGNTFNNNFLGIYAWQAFNDQTYTNNFIDNSIQIRFVYGSGNSFSQTAPTGGNYWSNYDTPGEGCNDLNNDGFCDSPFLAYRHGPREWWDYLPWTKRDGWEVQDLSIEISVPQELTLNEDGWYAENPVELKVKITNNTNETFNGKLEVSMSNSSRLLFDDEGEYIHAPVKLEKSVWLNQGQTKEILWPTWVQPMSQQSIVFTANAFSEDGKLIGQDMASMAVHAAQIHPIVVIPGLPGSMKDFNGEWIIDPLTGRYNNLIEQLRKAGYKDDCSLFPYGYDWKLHLYESGPELGGKIKDFLSDASRPECGYVDTSKVDIVAHSFGGLVARTYIQGGSYGNDVHRLITLGTPHRGMPEAYLRAEGLVLDGLEGAIQKALVQAFAFKKGYCTWGFRWVPGPGLTFGCWVNDAQLYYYILNEVPSSREVFPDDSYLSDYPGSYLIDYYDPTHTDPFDRQINSFLNSLNTNIDVLISRLGPNNVIPFVGDRETIDTDLFYMVVEPTPGDEPLWTNGKVLVREPGPGDETVPAESADLSLMDDRVSSIVVRYGDNHSLIEPVHIEHGHMPTQLQKNIVTHLTQTTPFFNAGFNDPLLYQPWMIINLSPVEIKVTDPLGRQVGVDFDSGDELAEIPGAYFSRSKLIDEPDFIFFTDGVEGVYQVELIGIAEGEYRVRMEVFTEEGSLTVGEISGTTSPGAEHQHTLIYDRESLPITPLSLEFYPPLSDGNENELHEINRNATLPIKFTVRDAQGGFVADNSVFVWVIDPTDWSSVVASFTVDYPGFHGKSDVIRIDAEKEQYIVNLHLSDYAFEPDKTYIVTAGVFDQQLGTSSFVVKSKGKK